MNWNEIIRNLREDNDLKQKDIAKLLNISQRTYSNYECGQVQPSIESLIKLADYYKVSVDYLVGRTDKQISKSN